ncbi:MAG: septal ring lytic transglycosylase RlpA family protein [Thiobacillaceae bacterium]|nr:septal ring lytic transglycosylase RlpA family protein [Thiobacillaceae bacterium]
MLPPMRGGGYYKDDGPGANPPPNLHAVPDAVPRAEPLHRFANNPYRVMGVSYTPKSADAPYRERGKASWYGRRFHGKPTSSGEPYDMYAMTAAHRTLPIPSYARVTNLDNGRSVVVRINDRGPFHADRIIDLSYTAAYKLDLLKGVGMVEVERVFPEEGDAPGSFAAEAVGEPGVTLTALPASPELVAPQAQARPPERPAVYLQLSAFSRAEAAEALAARLSRNLGVTLPGVVQRYEGGLYKVQAGPYNQAQEAEAAARQLSERLGLRPYKVAAGALGTESRHSAPTNWLQLGAFSNPAAAEGLVERLRSEPDLPGVQRIEADGLVKVQAGPYASRGEAERAAQRLAASLGMKPYPLVR